jgi:RNA polymerase sigma-70 factor (ECF subfamily)
MRADANAEKVTAAEAELVGRARQGDQSALEQLLQDHYANCLKLAISLTRNRADAEDDVQDACCKAFEHFCQYRGDGPFAAWLMRIVANQCHMRRRQEVRSRFLYLDCTRGAAVKHELIDPNLLPEDRLGRLEISNALQTEIRRVPPIMRNVVVLRDVVELPVAEVASRLGLSVPATKSRIARARIEVRARLARHCGRKGYSTLTETHPMLQMVEARVN